MDKKQLEIERAWNGLGNWWDRRTYKTKGLRKILCERQNWRCCYCGVRMQDERQFKTDSATLEHVVPRKHGGPDKENNIVIACYACNNSRGDGFSDIHIELLAMYERGEIT